MRVTQNGGKDKDTRFKHLFEDDTDIKKSKVERRNEKKRSNQRFKQQIRQGIYEIEEDDYF